MRRQERRRHAQAGVTLIEMLVVVTIIALFAALVAPNVFKLGAKAFSVKAKADVESMMTALGQYKLETGTFPTTEQGLPALRVRPQGVNNWGGPYIQKDVPNDPWGRPYIYKYPGEHGEGPDIISYGADGQPGGEGDNADIESWK